ncbi:MAG: hypothetical protein NWR73_01655 [Flavobacteriales bacterium]|nr:hypothetical protein [Flavobacteriales bacterium]
MKNIIALPLMFVSFIASAQTAYLLPSPTDASEEVTIYIDMNQSSDGTQNNALKAMLTDHPDDDVYIWTWQPAGPVGGNGDWGNSNEDNKMTKVGELLYTISFVPTEFYGVDGAQLFANGISCLAKLKDGNAYSGEYDGEAKSEDLSIVVIPKLCDRRVCVFPEIRQEDDFISITYDNTQETIAGLQNMSDDECYLYLAAKSGIFNIYPYVAEAMTTSTPELQMEPIAGEPGKFRFIFIARDFFEAVPADMQIDEIIMRVYRPGFTYSGLPLTENISILNCN